MYHGKYSPVSEANNKSKTEMKKKINSNLITPYNIL